MDHTFTLTITGTEHGEWQGQLRTAEREVSFESSLELLYEIDGILNQKEV